MIPVPEPRLRHPGFFETVPESVLVEMAFEEATPDCCCGEASGCVRLPVIDYDELIAAERDEYFIALLREADEEGARVEREGRRHW